MPEYQRYDVHADYEAKIEELEARIDYLAQKRHEAEDRQKLQAHFFRRAEDRLKVWSKVIEAADRVAEAVAEHDVTGDNWPVVIDWTRRYREAKDNA